MNALALAALADRIASRLSHDASRWRPADVRTAPGEPVPVAFRFVGGTPSYGPDLLEALRLRAAAPYADRRLPGAEPIVAADVERPSRVDVALRVGERDGAPGLEYELRFADSGAVASGWLPASGG